MSAPRVRAPLTKAIVEMIDELPPADRDAIREAAADPIAEVDRALRSSWIPLAVQLELLHQVDHQLGRAGYLDFCERHFMRTVETPLVRTAFDGAVRLFGVGPEAVFKVFRRSWAMISADAGEVELVELRPEALQIEVRALPTTEARANLFIEGFAATFTGVFRLFGIAGKAELCRVDYSERTAVYTGSWSAKPR